MDDEPIARRILRDLLAADPEVELAGECRDGREALEVLRSVRPDIVFLDVRMPGLDGLQVLANIAREDRPAIVFTTAHESYALPAFDEEAVDYLLKPFTDERFRLALGRAKQRTRAGATAPPTALSAGTAEGPAGYLSRFVIPRQGRVEVVDVADLDWVESDNQYVVLHASSGDHVVRQSMNAIERLLEPGRFFRAHRSAIIAFDRIVRLESRGGGTGRVLLRGGQWLPVARARIAELRRALAARRL